MNSYIANSRIATGLRDGSITAIMVRCKVQPSMLLDNLVLDFSHDKVIHSYPKEQRKFPLPYALGKEVYVREAFVENRECCGGNVNDRKYLYKADSDNPIWVDDDWGVEIEIPFKSPATMPKEAARTFITPVSVECKRVQEMTEDNILKSLGYARFNIWDNNLYDFVTYNKSAWDNNEYVFIYQVKTRTI